MAQTTVHGGIYADQTWTAANSPYVVDGDIVVFPGKTLTVEPGVVVLVSGYYSIEIRGKIVAIGSSTAPVTFTASGASPTTIAWAGIALMTSLGAAGSFEHVIVRFAQSAVSTTCCDSGRVYYKQCTFDSCQEALTGYTGKTVAVDSCLFTNNEMATVDADRTFTDCVFMGNDWGSLHVERTEFHRCLFKHNNSALDVSMGWIDSCVIDSNTNGAIFEYGGGHLTNSVLTNNLLGIKILRNGTAYVHNCRVCGNSVDNVRNESLANVDLTGNCWCSTDSATIESLIYDGYDDIHVGLVDYDIYNGACDSIVQIVKKAPALAVRQSLLQPDAGQVYPNPSTDQIFVRPPDRMSGLVTIQVTDILGRIVLSEQRMSLSDTPMDITTDRCAPGAYIVRVGNARSVWSTNILIR